MPQPHGPDDPRSSVSPARSTTPPPAIPSWPAERYYSWSELMRRVFAIDVLQCPRCGSAMKILAQIHPPFTTRAFLDCLGLPSRAPPIAPPRPDVADL